MQNMTNFDVTRENIEEHNPNWPKNPDHSYRILTVGDSGSGKTSSLFNLISHKLDINEIYMLKIPTKQNISC